jgi:peptidoglycan/xylan/chitin deacetylase (PgdA/CDA1 family)
MRYRIREKVLCGLIERGHEIGMHGLWPSNRESFLGEERMRAEFNNQKQFISRFSIKGYRSPSWYRTSVMFRVLSDFFSYDSSCLDNDLLCPGGSGGVGIMRPFRMKTGLVELPCTLPFDGPLYSGVSHDRLLEYWMPKIDFIRESCAMLLINTHPEPNYSGNDKMLKSYGKLLKLLSDGRWHCRLPKEICGAIKN